MPSWEKIKCSHLPQLIDQVRGTILYTDFQIPIDSATIRKADLDVCFYGFSFVWQLLLSTFNHTGNCDFPIGGHLVGILVPTASWKRYQFSVKLSQGLKSAFGFCRDRLESGNHAREQLKENTFINGFLSFLLCSCSFSSYVLPMNGARQLPCKPSDFASLTFSIDLPSISIVIWLFETACNR